MGKLAERLSTREFQLGVKQYRAVLDFTSDIEDELRARKMKQSTLAAILGKSRAWVSKILRQKPNLTVFTAVEVADALGLEVQLKLVRAQGIPWLRGVIQGGETGELEQLPLRPPGVPAPIVINSTALVA